jgi:hypothetical protein
MQSPMLHTSYQYTVSFLFLRVWHTTHHLCGLDFFTVGGILHIKYLSVRQGTVLSEKCLPGTLSSTALAYFTKSPSINWILNDNCPFSFPYVTPIYIIILSSHSELRCSRACEIASCTIYSFTSTQSNKKEAASPSNEFLSSICCNLKLKWVWPLPCL